MQFSDNSQYLVSISSDGCKIWKFENNAMNNIITIPGQADSEHREANVDGLACVDGRGELAVTYRGELHFNTYELRD